MIRRASNQQGFGAVESLIVVATILVLGVVGWAVYNHEHKTKPISSATTTTKNAPKQTTTASTGTQQTASQILVIKEWGVQLPLSSTISDAYYTTKGSNVGTDGLPNTAWLGLTSLNGNGCNISTTGPTSTATPVGSIIRVAPTDRDPVTGSLYTDQDPNGVTIGSFYYAYTPWKNNKCASAAALQSDNSAFASSAKATAKASAN